MLDKSLAYPMVCIMLILYHYNCTIFDNRGVKIVQLGVYIAIPTVDGEMIGELSIILSMELTLCLVVVVGYHLWNRSHIKKNTTLSISFAKSYI